MTHYRRSPAFLLVALALVVAMVQLSLPAGAMRRLGMVSVAETTISFSPPSVTIGVGQDIIVDVWISNVTDLAGVDLRMTYDPAVGVDAELCLTSDAPEKLSLLRRKV